MKTVIAFGTFDHFHKGHQFFLIKARKLGESFVITIARDINVLHIKKKLPYFSEKERKQQVEDFFKNDPKTQVILGDKKDYTVPLTTTQPNIIALGYDQRIPKSLEGLLDTYQIEHIQSFEPTKYKSSLISPKKSKLEE